ncbi:MAG: NeuD/PglB/VioB family sugar acetyltransferase [Cytophagales bacterium]|nr:NeuD/PglB/VioB family sugar acetyltransferase [Bernardetiaceae bacterium]MDW8205278.1 NeuD/PglB/VioB family sugar acetyltransferase [Cytophagales bacterium]
MENPVIILGASGLGRVAVDIFQSNDIMVYCLLDDDPSLHGKEIGAVAIVGTTDNEEYLRIIGEKCEAFVATDDNRLRKSLVKMLAEKRKKMPVNAIHKQAFIEPSASIGHGNLIAMQAAVGSAVQIGNHCIIHAGAIIDYEAVISDFVQIGAGSVVNSKVTIKEGAFIGSGVTIVSGVTIGKKARIGAGSVVIADVADGETVFGVPAKKV